MFPNYKKTFLGLIEVKDGWEDLGKVDYFTENGTIYYKMCMFCKKRLRIGKEKGKVFRYCPRCLTKIKTKI